MSQQFRDTPMMLDLLEAADFYQWPTSRLIRTFEQAVVRKRLGPGATAHRWNDIKLRVAGALGQRYDPEETERLLGLADDET